jgi:hypothetical protein
MVSIAPGFSFFRLVAPTLQPGVVGPCPVWAVWLPSHLLLDRTGCI